MKERLLLLALAALLTPLARGNAQAAANEGECLSSRKRVAVVSSGGGVASVLAGRLRKAGFDATELTAEELTQEGKLKANETDALILPDSERCPLAATANLEAFAKAGGDLVFLGGRAFADPTVRVGKRWLTAAMLESEWATISGQIPLLDPSDYAAKQWVRDTDLDTKSTVVPGEDSSNRTFCFSFKGYRNWAYDTFATKLDHGAPAGHDLLIFDLRCDAPPGRPLLTIEVADDGGGVWDTPVEIGNGQMRRALHVGQFAARTKIAADQLLDLARIRELRLGFTTGGSSEPVDRDLVIGNITTARSGWSKVPDWSTRPDFGVFADDSVYDMPAIARVGVCQGQEFVKPHPEIIREMRGISAVGFPLADKSAFIPLLRAYDRLDREQGWAAGLLVNYGGAYRGSNWLLFGIRGDDFYLSDEFGSILAECLSNMLQRDLVTWGTQQNRRHKEYRPPEQARNRSGAIHLSDDRRQLIRSDGHPFFMIGANYLGPSAGMFRFAREEFDVDAAEASFRLASEYGINTFRIWAGEMRRDPEVRGIILNLARKYGIHLLLAMEVRRSTIEEITEEAKAWAQAFRSEEIVIGYDLLNEPWVGQIGAIRFGGEKSPLLLLDAYRQFKGAYDQKRVDWLMTNRPAWPPIARWVTDEDERRELYTVSSILEKDPVRWGAIASTKPLEAAKQLPDSDPWKRTFVAVNETFDRWIRPQVETIRKIDPAHLICVGYDSSLQALPANAQLDFISYHVYGSSGSGRRSDPRYRTEALVNLASLWPDKPITAGEFGYSNGDFSAQGNGYVDPYASAVGEMAHLLRSFALGQNGGIKWMLSDWPVATQRDSAPWISPDQRSENSGYGFFFCDGTVGGRPKPIAHGVRVLRRLVDRGGPRGKLTMHDADIPVHGGYVFEAEDALLIGDRRYDSPRFSFRAEKPANVMLLWDRERLEITSTADADVSIEPQAFIAALRNKRISARGARVAAQQIGSKLSLRLLEGETVILQVNPE